MLADLYPRRIGGDRLELAANLGRRLGLRIEAVVLGEPAGKKDVDRRPRATLPRWRVIRADGWRGAQRFEVVHPQSDQPDGAGLHCNPPIQPRMLWRARRRRENILPRHHWSPKTCEMTSSNLKYRRNLMRMQDGVVPRPLFSGRSTLRAGRRWVAGSERAKSDRDFHFLTGTKIGTTCQKCGALGVALTSPPC